jgi:hypothetical protein
MKFILQAVCVFTMCHLALGEDTDGPSGEDWNVHVELEVISLPTRKALAMLPALQEDAKLADAYQKLKAIAESAEAKVEANLTGRTMHGADLKLTQVEEIRYPIEFEQPSPVTPNFEAKPTDSKAHDPKQRFAISYPGTTFETRAVGISLSVSFGVSVDGKRFFVTAEPEHSWLLRWDDFEVGRLANNEKIIWKQPRIAVAKSAHTFGMSSGERLLLSAHPIPGKPDRHELFFLRAWTTPRPTAPGR